MTDDASNNLPLTAAPGARRSGLDACYDRIRSWGIVRGEDRWIAGVAGALGRRTRLDPLVVRVAFVVLALLGGVGLGLYGLCWALLPDARGRIEADAARTGDVSAALVAAGGLVLANLLLGGNAFGLVWW